MLEKGGKDQLDHLLEKCYITQSQGEAEHPTQGKMKEG